MNQMQTERFKSLILNIRLGKFKGKYIDLSAFNLLQQDAKDLIDALKDAPQIRRRIKYIDLSNNEIQYLILDGFENLQELTVSSNQLVLLSVSKCPNLLSVDAGTNQLESLDLNQLQNLYKLNVAGNSLINLNLHSNKKLHNLDLRQNRIRELDLSFMLNLQVALLNGNPLESLLITGTPLTVHLTYNGAELNKISRSALCRRKELAISNEVVLDLNDTLDQQITADPGLLLNSELFAYFAMIKEKYVHTKLRDLLFETKHEVALLEQPPLNLPHHWAAEISMNNFIPKLEAIFLQHVYELLVHRCSDKTSPAERSSLAVKQLFMRDFVNNKGVHTFFADLIKSAKRQVLADHKVTAALNLSTALNDLNEATQRPKLLINMFNSKRKNPAKTEHAQNHQTKLKKSKVTFRA